MTGYANNQYFTQMMLKEQFRTRCLLRGLMRVILLLLLVALLLTAGLAVAKQFPAFYHVTPATVTVSAGSSLWEIAEEHMGEYPGTVHGYIAEICRLNGIENPALIQSGSRLTIPIYRCKLG